MFVSDQQGDNTMTAAQTIHAQLDLVAEVTRNEQWLEGERRGRAVPACDPTVQARVFAVAMECGDAWRRNVEKTEVI